MKFIEMYRVKVLLTGCVLLLMLNCYQSYGDDFTFYYDAQSKTVKTLITRIPTLKEHCIYVQLSSITTWEAAAQLFNETQKKIKGNKISPSFSSSLWLLNGPILINPCSISGLRGIVREENPRLEIKAFLSLGDLYKEHGGGLSGILAQACYEDALNAAKGAQDPSLEAMAYLGLGNLYRLLRRADQALRCHEDALNAAKGAQDPSLEAMVYLNLGNLHEEIGYSRGEEFYQKARSAARLANDPFLEAMVYLILGIFYEQKGRFLDAERSYNDALMSLKVPNNPAVSNNSSSLEAMASYRLGNVYGYLRRPDEAKRCYQNAISGAEVANDPTLVAKAIASLRQLDKSPKMVNESISIEKLVEQPVTLPSYKELVKSIEEDPMDVDPAAKPY